MKNSTIILLCISLIALNVNAQLKVANTGKAGVNIGTNTPLSNLSVNAVGNSNTALWVTGATYGIYAERSGTPGETWVHSVLGNASLGPIDAYGNISSISSPYTPPSHLITSTETWQGSTIECGNVIVKNGGNLTLDGATINLEGNAGFSVEVGGILTFNNGVIQ